jgi:hypothetical protein
MNEQGIFSEPDEVIVTVIPSPLQPPTTEEPQRIKDMIKNIIQNPLDVTNSIASSQKIIDILTEGNPDNYDIVCDLLNNVNNDQINHLKKAIDCQ